MAVNKVEYSGDTLIDLTSDTVTQDSLLSGATAHNSAGEKISGNVDLSEYLKNNGNASNTTVSFTEATNMAELVTDENMGTLFGKLKLTVRNVISVLKLIGSTDISSIGGGTITGAIAKLNSNLSGIIEKIEIPTTNFDSGALIITDYIPDGKIPIAFKITSGLSAHQSYIWTNLANGEINVTFRSWYDNASVAGGKVSGILICV